jgi:hypothetical protein
MTSKNIYTDNIITKQLDMLLDIVKYGNGNNMDAFQKKNAIPSFALLSPSNNILFRSIDLA